MKGSDKMKRTALFACLFAFVIAAPALAQNDDPTRPIKTAIGAIRQSKDDQAINQFADEEQGRILLGDYWARGTDAQRKEFTQLFHTLFANIAFPKVRDNLKNLDTILYEPPRVVGGTTQVGSTILINHPLKKQELKLKYTVTKQRGGWKVVDVAVLGDSMLSDIRDDQVQPLLKEGGWDGLLNAMRQKAAELRQPEQPKVRRAGAIRAGRTRG
jgi:phospholipid transport system substrate-binding protein